MITKGIVLAGGSGTRLYPLSTVMSKQLQAVYDKPMIYYPLATLMYGGIRDILIISTPKDTPYFRELLKDGTQWGLNFSYKVQEQPGGIAQAFIYGEEFIGKDQICLILGDNLFYGDTELLSDVLKKNKGGTIFGYRVNNPQDYGVIEFDKSNNVLSIEEKPKQPKSNYAIPGLYIFDSEVVEISKNLKPSARGELEITDVQKAYMQKGKLKVNKMGRGMAWLDTGTPESLLDASTFIHAIEKRQGRKIACLEEIALEKGFITKAEYLNNLNNLPNSSYKQYCLSIVGEF